MNEIIFPEGITWKQRYITGGDVYDGYPLTMVGNLYRNAINKVININFSTSSVTDMSYMFQSCPSLQYITQFDTSSVTSMNNMFNNCTSLITIPQLDTSSVTDMSSMLYSCGNLNSIPQLDAGSVTSISGLFGYSTFNSLVDIGGFNKLKASLTSNAFDRTPKLTVDSLMNIINGLWDWTDYPDGNAPLNDGTIYSFGTTHTLKFGTTNLAKLSADQIAIATNKGWTLN